jgi:hypothetical protein
MVEWWDVCPCRQSLNGRLAMTEPKDLLLAIEQLRRSNRRWKTLALAACSALILMAVVSYVATTTARMRLNHELRAVNAALASAHQARVNAQRAPNPRQPR